MVAYSFKRAFVDDIVARTKRQTIRLPRKRHALPGERIQLYTAMRTRHCRKIIPDPVCVGVDEVVIDLRAAECWLEVNGIQIRGEEADTYARGDGFQGSLFVGPFRHMARWWIWVHGPILFEGVAIRWEDRP